MIIDSLELANFMSYRQKTSAGKEEPQKFEFTHSDEKNITLIVGHGGGGKSTVGEAIKWVLYNLPFQGDLKKEEYLSLEAMYDMMWRPKGGAYTKTSPEMVMWVKMHVKLGNSLREELKKKDQDHLPGIYTLKRNYVSTSLAKPGTSKTSNMTFNIDGPTGSPIKYSHDQFVTEFLLPEDISAFFMMHGKKIEGIVNKITEDQEDAIKRIMDVTPTKNAISDLNEITTHYYKEYSKYSKQSGEAEKLRTSLVVTEENLRKKQEQIGGIEGDIKKKKDRQARIRKKTDAHLDDMSKEGKLKDMQRDLQEKEADLESAKKVRQQVITNFTYEGLWHILHNNIEEYEPIQKINNSCDKEIEKMNIRINELKTIEVGKKCHTCKLICSHETYKDAQKEIFELNKKISTEDGKKKYLDPKYEDVMNWMGKLEDKKYESASINSKIRFLEKDILDTNGNIKNFRKEMGTKVTDEGIREMMDELTQLCTDIGGLERDVLQVTKFMEDIEKQRKKIKLEMGKLQVDAKYEKYKKFAEFAEDLKKVFNSVLTELADGKREDIGKLTGHLLKKLTLQPSLYHNSEPVKITENYEIKRYNNDNHELPYRNLNTSEKYIVALSYIFGLMKVSERGAPIILDTVFGNLDPMHYTKMSEVLGDHTSQIILMCTRQEFQSLKENASDTFWDSVNKYFFVQWGEINNYETQITTKLTKSEAFEEADLQEKLIREGKLYEKKPDS